MVVSAGIVYALYRLGLIGPDKTLALLGPALMIRTQRGRAFLDRVGRHQRAWTVIADIGLILAFVAMAVIVAALVFDAAIALTIPPSSAPPATELLGLPGINPIIPITYGIIALIVGVVVHELFHGFVARSQSIGVKSLGVLFCVIPIGAFVEQDEEEMTHASRRKRDRVAAAGVLANFAMTGVFFLVCSLLVSSFAVPNANGVGVAAVISSTPAQNASIAAGDILTMVNGTETTTNAALTTALAATHPGERVNVTFVRPDLTTQTTAVVLTSLATYTNQTGDRSKAFLGVSLTYITPSQLKATFVFPPTASSNGFIGLTEWLVLPLAGLQPVQGTTTSFFHLSGALAGTDSSGFWFTVNIFYWLAWMNLLLGLSNALPLVPLDGGLLFRDLAAGTAGRARKGWDTARLEKFAGRAVGVSSVLVVVLILWQFIVPRL